jgi:hypothetical protein
MLSRLIFASVWVIAQFESAAGIFLDLLLQARSKLAKVRVQRIGVPILDRFADRLSERTNEDWKKWQLCCYAEIGVELMCYGLSRATRPATTPESLFKEGRGPSFDAFREVAERLAATATIDGKSWGARFFAHLVQDEAAVSALETIISQRNNLAHGRQTLPLDKIKKLVTQGLQLESWEQIQGTDGELRLIDWQPWVRTPSSGTGKNG